MAVDAAAWAFGGSILGSATTLAAIFVTDHIAARRREQQDAPRKALLLKMLESAKHDWRDMDTMSRVIGADRNETARLLVALGARGSEDGRDVWALIKHKPLP